MVVFMYVSVQVGTEVLQLCMRRCGYGSLCKQAWVKESGGKPECERVCRRN